jgi:DNA-binding SARP family transcriptional activator/tetratricopeptide (TPR) repeat protein
MSTPEPAGAVSFGVLGPLLLARGRQPVPVTSAKQRALLSVLLLHANLNVPTDRLIDELWGAQPPCSARELVATYVWRVRRLMRDVKGESARLRAEPSGYRLRVAEDELDVIEFDRLFAEGRTMLTTGDAVGAATALTAALALWRGDPLSDVRLQGQSSDEVVRLAEQRLWALEHRIEADIAVGRHEVVVGELRQVVERYPTRERFAAQLMRVLYRCGRRGDALAVYPEIRARLVETLGVEPGPEIRDVHAAILRDDLRLPNPATLAEPASGLRPAQLPMTDTSFRGRRSELGHLDAILSEHTAGDGSGPLLVVLSGAGGMGKTSLAVHWAHQVRARFPDGQLFVDLRGYSAQPPEQPLAVLRRLLCDLGVSASQMPVDWAGTTAQYRTVLADRRILLVLDNVADPDAVAVLLPAGPRGAVVVTSRDPLSELVVRYGARRIALGPFDPDESRAVLATGVTNPQRMVDQPAVDELAAQCGHVPLALRLAVAHLEDHPRLPLREYITQLQRGNRLTTLDGQRGGLHAAFDFSYRALSTSDANAFRLLGVTPGRSMSVPAAAALLGTSDGDAEQTLDRLARTYLLDARDGVRFTMHDLLRAYAVAVAEADEPPESRRRAIERWLDWCLASVITTDHVIDPHRYRKPLHRSPSAHLLPAMITHRDAVGWLDEERVNLVAAVFWAADHRPAMAWRLAWALFGYFAFRKPWTDWVDTYRVGLSCAQAIGDRHGEAVMLYGLGTAHYYPRRFAESLDCFRGALRLYREGGDRRGEGLTLNLLGNVFAESRQLGPAVRSYLRALGIHRLDRNLRDEGVVLNNLSEIYGKVGCYQQAEEHARQALVIQRSVGNRRTEVLTLCHLGNALAGLDRVHDGLALLHDAVALADEIGDRHGAAWASTYLGQVMFDMGRPDEAGRQWERAEDLFVGLGDPNVAVVRAKLAGLHRQSRTGR